MQALLGQLIEPATNIFADFINPILLRIGFLTLMFLALGLWFAKLKWGAAADRLKSARDESLRLTSRANEIVEDQNLMLTKLKKSSAVYKADIAFRDNKINKLQGDFQRIQADLNTRIESESNLTGLLRTRDRDIERLKNELANAEAVANQLGEKEQEIIALREDLATKEGVYTRLSELEGIVDQRDAEIERVNNEFNELTTRFNQTSFDLQEKTNAFLALEQNQTADTSTREKIVALEDLLDRRDEDVTRLRGERDKVRTDLETIIRERETKIMDLEDDLGEKEAVIEAFQSESPNAEALEEYENIIAERDLEIEELKKAIELKNLTGAEDSKLQEEFDDMVEKLRQRDSEIQNIKKQYHEAKQQREAKFLEVTNQLESQEGELKSLRALQSSSDKLKAKVSDLEWSLEEKDEDLKKMQSDRDRLKDKLRNSTDHSSKIEDLEQILSERNREIDALRSSKTSSDSLHTKIKELEWLLTERENEIDTYRSDRLAKDSLLSRVQDLERGMHLRDDELERLTKEKQELSHLLRITESDVESMRKERVSYDVIQSRVNELERSLVDRERELDLLKKERTELSIAEREAQDLQDSLRLRVRELESQLSEMNGSRSAYVRVEKTGSSDDIYERIRDLERMVADRDRDRDRETRVTRNYDKSEYRFTLGDGTVTYLKADETIEHEGKTYTAEDLYYVLRERGLG